MSFHVYPDPQTAALTLPSGAATATFTAIVQLSGASDPAGAYRKMMFIRVAMFGGTTAPELLIKADTGNPVTITAQTNAVFKAPGATGYVGDVQLFTAGEPTNVFQIRMGFDTNT